MTFSLRSLLVCVTVICISLGIWLERARRQQEIVKAIRDAGGHVEYEFEDAKAIPRREPFWHSAPYGQDLVDCVESVTINDRRLLSPVARLYGVKSLTVEDSALCDEDLGSIQKMHRLRSLRLMGNAHEGMFSGNPSLFRIDESFFHHEAQLTDRALAKLAVHSTLAEVIIHGGDYSKTGIQELAKLRTLRVLYIDFAERAESQPEKDWLTSFRDLPHLQGITLLSSPNAAYTVSTRPWVVKEGRDWINEHF